MSGALTLAKPTVKDELQKKLDQRGAVQEELKKDDFSDIELTAAKKSVSEMAKSGRGISATDANFKLYCAARRVKVRFEGDRCRVTLKDMSGFSNVISKKEQLEVITCLLFMLGESIFSFLCLGILNLFYTISCISFVQLEFRRFLFELFSFFQLDLFFQNAFQNV